MTTISAIIPTNKPQKRVWKYLDSLVVQTLPYDAFEVIIVLNGCCEPYKSRLTAYISSKMLNMHSRFIQVDDGGVSRVGNLALEVA